MKKLLLGSVAILGLAAAAPAHADGVKLDLGGHFKGYVTWVDQDDTAGAATESRNFDILRETEIHFTGETTLDNGLTVGVHHEADIDQPDSFATEESYAYFSGAWGRFNFGMENGAAYLLQVAAPSADSNLDGIRQFINPVNYGLTDASATASVTAFNTNGLDYDNDMTTYANKLTYMTPVFNGFQAGVSYTPDVANGTPVSRGLDGVNADSAADAFGSAWEVGARYEGTFDQLGVVAGAGYTKVDLEEDAGLGADDMDEWNVGLDLNWGAFGLGAIYTENNGGVDADGDDETWVVGLDYTTGPFKLGASYLNNDVEQSATTEVETDRYTGGVVYTYGPGMTFRGSVSYVDHDLPTGTDDVQATSVLLGTQIDF